MIFKNPFHINVLAGCLLLWSAVPSQTLSEIESVEYDSTQNRWLISNGNNIIARAPDGTLSVFGDGVTAEFGMEVMGQTLFAITDGGVAGYDLASEEEVMWVDINDAQFLNGLANDGERYLYATDFMGQKIFRIDVADLDNPAVEELVSNITSSPNGIVYDPLDDRLVFVNWDNNAPIIAVDLSDNSMSTVKTTGVAQCDGIDMDGEGNFFIACWEPDQIIKFDHDFSGDGEVVNEDVNNPADISYSLVTDSLGIPNAGDNTLTFVAFDGGVVPLAGGNKNAGVRFQQLDGLLLLRNLPYNRALVLKVRNLEGRLLKTVTLNVRDRATQWAVPEAFSGHVTLSLRQGDWSYEYRTLLHSAR